MSRGNLSPLQLLVLESLAGVEPTWTLTGGGALAGFHLHHRTTRDLDLFLRGQAVVGDAERRVEARLRAAGIEVEPLQRDAAFVRLRAAMGGEVTIVDLVAEPVPAIEPALVVRLGAAEIQVDSLHEILVNKLCALLSRSELRDLLDLERILASGGDLLRALHDAPSKDRGFSPLTLAWVLHGLPVERLAATLRLDPSEVARLVRFRDDLVTSLAGAGADPR